MQPNPDNLYPIPNSERTAFLKNIVKNPNIIVGDYTYYDDPDDVHNFEKNILYHFDFIGDKLIIGKFCQIATGVKFAMNGGNHDLNGFPHSLSSFFNPIGLKFLFSLTVKKTPLLVMMCGLVMAQRLCQGLLLVMVPLLARVL